ncbi:hypothetical protein FF38_14039, partial [Lucilia cuprina]
KAAAKGANGLKKTKVYTTTTFHRPKTLALPRKPTYANKAVNHYPRMDEYKVIISSVNSEGATQKIEDANTLVLYVHIKANKDQIKYAVKKLYGAEVLKVNTLVRPDGTKKAFVRLTPDHDALDVASRAGFL